MFPIKIFPSLIPFASFVEEIFNPSIASFAGGEFKALLR